MSLKLPKGTVTAGSAESLALAERDAQINKINELNAEMNDHALNIRTEVTLEGITILTNGHNRLLNISGEGITPEFNMLMQLIYDEVNRINTEKMVEKLIENHCNKLGISRGDLHV